MAKRSLTPVLLLKTQSSPTDPYQDLFVSTGEFDPNFIPVFEHRSINTEDVRKYITNGDLCDGQVVRQGGDGSGRFGGLVITSQRAVEVLGSIIDELKGTQEEMVSELLKKTLIYVVGPATRNALVNLGFLPSNVLGEESGNGGALADFIAEDYKSSKDLLFLVGETHGTVIPHRLRDRDPKVEVEELVVYKTDTKESFEGDFRSILDSLSQKPDTKEEEEEEEEKSVWIVIFSPTGTKEALTVLADRESPDGVGKIRYKICTIGPTTTDYMWQKFKKKPDTIAKVPSPEGVLQAIREHHRVSLEVTL